MSVIGALITRYVAAANAHDAVEAASFMAPDVQFEDIAMSEVLYGRDAVRDYFERGSQTLSSNVDVEVVSTAGELSDVTIEWVLSGTHDGGTPTMPATNRPFKIRGVSVAKVVDGEFASYRDYYDLAGFLVQVGLLPTA